MLRLIAPLALIFCLQTHADYLAASLDCITKVVTRSISKCVTGGVQGEDCLQERENASRACAGPDRVMSALSCTALDFHTGNADWCAPPEENTPAFSACVSDLNKKMAHEFQ